MQVDLDQRIPPALYRAVAELLVWVYRLEQGGLQAAITPAAEKSVASATKASDMP
jgi:flagellar biosynthesis protein